MPAPPCGGRQPQEINGLRLFIGKGQCATCHNGPLLTDQSFHNTGVPQRDPQRPDRGRTTALAKVQQDEFNCLGPFSDAKPEACQELAYMTTDPAGLEAAFKTLRNVAMRPPYMHARQFAPLQKAQADQAVGAGVRDVAAFLGTLTGQIVERSPYGR